MTVPDVSIVISCYNRESLVGKAIASALAQQGVAFEIVVVDDGSSDRSWDIIGAFGATVRTVWQPNRGVSAARNEGIRQSRGRYIKFLDSDDLLPANAVEKLLFASSSVGPRDIVFGNAALIGLDDLPAQGPSYGFPAMPSGMALAWPTLLSGTMSPWLPLFPRAALLDIGGFNEAMSIGEDQELAVRLKKHGYQFVRIDPIVALVREHDGARLSRGTDVQRYARELVFLQHIAIQLRDVNPAPSALDWQALGRLAWVRGRDAARNGLRDAANSLFAFALEVGGRDVRSNGLRMLYAVMSPYDAEQWTGKIKRLVKRGIVHQ